MWHRFPAPHVPLSEAVFPNRGVGFHCLVPGPIQWRSPQCYNPAQIRNKTPMPENPCKHQRVRLVAKDEDAQYVECLDCGEILEAGELTEGDGFNESLSDA
jgi:hypothetical protein